MYNNIFSKRTIKTGLSFRQIRVLGAVLMLSILSACSMGTNQKALTDLKVLSLLIPKLTNEVVSSGDLQALERLEKSQDQLNQALLEIKKDYSNQPDLNGVLKNGQAISSNIDILLENKNNFENFYDDYLNTADLVSGIQAEYNLMVDQMARNNYSASQVVLGKNQVFIAERILRSLQTILKNDENARASLDDLSADIEIFNIYVKAQINGNAELGVEKIKGKALEESLQSIQKDADAAFTPLTNNFLQNPQLFLSNLKAAQDNVAKSDEIFNALERWESAK